MLPGGMPGAANLNLHEGLRKLLVEQNGKGKRLGAICAAPMVLGSVGVLKEKRATCYPGFEKRLTGAEHTGELCTIDGNITTGKGTCSCIYLWICYIRATHFCRNCTGSEGRNVDFRTYKASLNNSQNTIRP